MSKSKEVRPSAITRKAIKTYSQIKRVEWKAEKEVAKLNARLCREIMHIPDREMPYYMDKTEYVDYEDK